MIELHFDKTVRPTQIYVGAAPTHQALKDLFTVSTAGAARREQWNLEMGLPADHNDVFLPLFSGHFLERGRAVQRLQCESFAAGGDAFAVPGLKFQLADELVTAFAAVATNHRKSSPIEIVAMDWTRETSMFALQQKFPDVPMHATLVCASAEDAAIRNDIVNDVGGVEATRLLTYVPYLEEKSADLVFANSCLQYDPVVRQQKIFGIFARTGADYVVMAGTLVKEKESDPNNYWGQQYFGGIVAARATGKADLITRMDRVGYEALSMRATAPLYDVTQWVDRQPQPKEAQFLFQRHPEVL